MKKRKSLDFLIWVPMMRFTREDIEDATKLKEELRDDEIQEELR